MSTNADFEYGLAEKKYLEAKTNEEKLEASKKMLSTAPNHKASQVMRAEIKSRIAKLKAIMDKEKQQKNTFKSTTRDGKESKFCLLNKLN